jgi:hypothetical protein
MRGTQAGGPALEIKLLGPVQVSLGARSIALPRRQQRALVALLALRANSVVSIDELSDALWENARPRRRPSPSTDWSPGYASCSLPRETRRLSRHSSALARWWRSPARRELPSRCGCRTTTAEKVRSRQRCFAVSATACT